MFCHPFTATGLAQALGVLLFVLCFGRLPFAGDSKLQILNGKYDMPPTPSRAPQVRPAAAGRQRSSGSSQW